MLNHTKKIKTIYEDIQKRLFYMIPEKWEKLYLYSSVIDKQNGEQTGELYFYYIPRGILKKKPVNVYEIPNRFNLDENDYMKLVKILYNKIKQLREEFKKSETGTLWSNITMTIGNMKFKVEYNYDDLEHSTFSSYERHIIWRYEYLGIGEEQVSKKEKEILNRYLTGPKILKRKENYETGLYIRDIENKIAYNNTDENKPQKEMEENRNTNTNIRKNQLLLSEEQIKEFERKRKNNNYN